MQRVPPINGSQEMPAVRLAAMRRDDDAARAPARALAPRQPILAVASQRLDLLAEDRRHPEASGVVLEISDHLLAGGIPRDVAGKRAIRQGGRRLGRVQAQAIRSDRAPDRRQLRGAACFIRLAVSLEIASSVEISGHQ